MPRVDHELITSNRLQTGNSLLSWKERSISNTLWIKVSHHKDGCFGEPRIARQGDKFDKELIKSLGLLGQPGEGQISDPDTFRRRVEMRLHREHPRRPRRKNCISNERSLRGTYQADKPKIGKTGQRLTEQAQLSSVLRFCINSVQSWSKSSWVLSSPEVSFYQYPQVQHTWGESS